MEGEIPIIEGWHYLRDKKPICHLCRVKFKPVGENKWMGNCSHFRGRVVEW
jgi:hypothetical protein